MASVTRIHSAASAATTSPTFWGFNAGASQTNEDVAKTPWRAVGQFRALTGHVNATGTSRAVNLRKNKANGNLTISFLDSTDEITSDWTNVDTVALGDTIDYQVTWATSGPQFDTISVNFRADSGHAFHFYTDAINGTRASTTFIAPGASTTENIAVVPRVAATTSNLTAHVNTNSVTATSTATMRIGLADGNQTVAVPSSTTGIFEDTTHTDSISSSTVWDIKWQAGATGSTTNAFFSFLVSSSSGQHDLYCSGQVSTTLGYYAIPSGFTTVQTSEFVAETRRAYGATVSNLRASFSSSTSSGTITFRINGANGNQTISIPASTTGTVEDTTHTDSIGPADFVNIKVTQSTATAKAYFYIAVTETPNDTAVGSSTGSAAAVAVGTTIAAGSVGSSAGHATVSGIGRAIRAAVASASGHATVSSVGRGTDAGIASASGHTTLTGVGRSTNAAIGSISGHASSAVIGRGIFQAVAAAAGHSSITAVGRGIFNAIASSAGHASATAVGATGGLVTAVAAAHGAATAQAVGKGFKPAVASAAGHSSVAAVGVRIAVSIGTAAGHSTVQATARPIGQGIAVVSGHGVPLGIGHSQAASVAVSNGAALTHGVAGASEMIGVAAGHSAVIAIGRATFSAIGIASGHSSVNGIGRATTASIGVAAGHSTVTGVGHSTAASIAIVAGHSTDTGVGHSTAASIAAAAGHATILGHGTGLKPAIATSAGHAATAMHGTSIAQLVGVIAASSIVVGTGRSTFNGHAAAAGHSSVLGHVAGIHESIATALGAASAIAVGVLPVRIPQLSFQSRANTDLILLFAKVEHPSLEVPIRIVTEDVSGISYKNGKIVNYKWDEDGTGILHLYQGCPFTFAGLSDNDQSPRTQISVPNINRKVGLGVLQITDTPRIRITGLVFSDFDPASILTDPDNAYVPFRTPQVWYDARHLFLRNVVGDEQLVTADVVSFDVSNEPCPPIRTTMNRTPGLYR